MMLPYLEQWWSSIDELDDLPGHRFRCWATSEHHCLQHQVECIPLPVRSELGHYESVQLRRLDRHHDLEPRIPDGNSTVKGGGETTGIFTMWKPYAIQNVTDGTSNTLGFAEALVGNYAGGRVTAAAFAVQR